MDELQRLAERAGEALAARGWMLVTAESCTGGWVAQAVTAVAGSSAWFDRGFVTYSNAAKRQVLGVPEQLLAEHGAVSAATVEAMASGALAHSEAQLAVSVSGVAGPGGGSATKPVGTVWLGWATCDATVVTRVLHLGGDRTDVRLKATFAALEGVIERADGLASR